MPPPNLPPRPLFRSYGQEFSTSNFFAVTQDNKFVTPDSPAVLPSITNKSLMQLAEDEGMVVEHRPVPFDEVASFKEVAACGTAVVMTTIKQIVKGGEVRGTGGLLCCLVAVSAAAAATATATAADDVAFAAAASMLLLLLLLFGVFLIRILCSAARLPRILRTHERTDRQHQRRIGRDRTGVPGLVRQGPGRASGRAGGQVRLDGPRLVNISSCD